MHRHTISGTKTTIHYVGYMMLQSHNPSDIEFIIRRWQSYTVTQITHTHDLVTTKQAHGESWVYRHRTIEDAVTQSQQTQTKPETQQCKTHPHNHSQTHFGCSQVHSYTSDTDTITRHNLT